MTSLSPPTPSDDERALRLAARAIDGFIEQVRELEAALLGVREAHSATKAALDSLIEAIDGVRDEVQYDEDLDYLRFDISEPWRSKAEAAVLALLKAESAALASKESNSE